MAKDLYIQLGPAVEINVKLRMPAAFLEYIQEVAREDLDNIIAYRDKEIIEHYLGSV